MLNLPSWLKILLKLALAGISTGLAIVCGTVLYLSPQLPEVEQLRDVQLQTPLKVFSADNKLIGEFGDQRRSPIRFDQIPEDYVNALLAAEDDNFFNHHGVDLFGLLRAVSQIITTGDIQSGGSTITMQVARHFFLTLDQTFIRKFNEILLAFQIEHELSKEEILELYANKMFHGKRAHGIQAAANVYYGKNVDALTLSQIAMISGLYKAPTTRNPINNPEAAIERRDWILGRMRRLNYIDQTRYDTAIAEPLSATQHGSSVEVSAPYAAEMVRAEMYRQFGDDAYTQGYEVYTTLDSSAQIAADNSIVHGVLAYDARHGYRGAEASASEDIYLDADRTIEYLEEIPSVAGLIPAVVTKVGDTSAVIYIREHGYIDLAWENGLSTAKPYKTPSWQGKAPTTAKEVVTPGDLIRVRLNDESQWQLSQLPNAQAALVALNPQDGAILALSGGFDFYNNRFNRAISAKRQPGSNLKPFMYAAALSQDFNAATVINDAPIVLEDAALEGIWRPENDTGKFYGPTRFREALYRSRNLVSIRILRSLGIHKARQAIMQFGFAPEDLANNLTLALGSEAVEPIKIARGYAAFANGGYLIHPYLITEIRDRRGDALFRSNPPTVCHNCDKTGDQLAPFQFAAPTSADNLDNNPPSLETPPDESIASDEQDTTHDTTQNTLLNDQAESIAEQEIQNTAYPSLATLEPIQAEQILDPRVHFIMDSILKDVIQRGTGHRARTLERGDIAGKTGTTNGPRDAWFSGYTPDIVTTTWLGFDDNSELGSGEFGGTAALPIWIDFMQHALKDKPERYFKEPEGLVIARIDPETGERTANATRGGMLEYFLKENTPPLTAEMTGKPSTEIEMNTGDLF